jgi:hypothetical protein
VAVAAVVALPTTAPEPNRQDALFVAAAAAQRSGQDAGIYWHYRVESDSFRYEYWIKPDGYRWHRYEDGKVEKMPDRKRHPFKMLSAPLTLDQLRALPTDPEALRAWVDETIGDYDGGFKERNPLDSLVSLVSFLPTSPAVRTAAFRAIAAYPGVVDLGEVPGGRGVLLPKDGLLTYSTDSNGEPEKDRLVMDPTTGLLVSTTYYVNLTGERYFVGSPGARITAEWTDVLPS